jgi:heptosyltransferase II
MLATQPNNGPSHSASRICVMMPTWVGDACMATPTLRAIRQSYPSSKITMIARPIIQELLDGAWGDQAPWYDESVLVTKRGNDVAHSRFQLTKVSRQKEFELAILLTNSFWSAAVMRLAGVHRIVGYNRDARGWLLTDPVMVPRDHGKLRPISAVDYYLQLAERIGCDASNRTMQLHVHSAESMLADAFWRKVGFDATVPTLVVNSNAATDPERIWPQAKVAALALRVAKVLGWQVLLHCGPKERQAANEVSEELNHPRVASLGVEDELPIGLSKAVMQRASVVVSTDSGPRHIAVALNRQVISLFGPTTPEWTTTYNQPEVNLQSETRVGRSSIANIEVDSVFASVQRIAAEVAIDSRVAA